MAKHLTMTAVQKMRPGAERIEVHDSGCKGLTLIIRPSGLKSWAMRFRLPDGKLFRMTIGPVDLSGREADEEPEIGKPMTLAAARRVATEVQRKRALGHDFKAAKHREKFEREARAAATFGAAALDFVDQHARPKVRGWREVARLLGIDLAEDKQTLELVPKGLADRWRDRSIHDIDADDIYAIVDEAREKGAPGRERRKGRSESRARKMHAALSKMFAWLLDRRRVKANPCTGIKTVTPKARKRVLNDAEIVWFWTATSKLSGPFRQAFRLLLLTGERLNEVAGMRLSEMSRGGALWTIPSERTKNHLDHEVPMAPMARDIIEELVPLPSGTARARSNSADTMADLIFTTTGTTPISGWSRTKKRLDEYMLAEARKAAVEAGRDPSEVTLPRWRLHDLRRTCATGMADIGVLPHIVEGCLNHISGAKAGVAGTYNRSAYRPEKKLALERWAAHVEALVSGRESNVVPFQAAERAEATA